MANIKFNLGSIILIIILAIIGGLIGSVFYPHGLTGIYKINVFLGVLIGCILGSGLGFAIMLMKQKSN